MILGMGWEGLEVRRERRGKDNENLTKKGVASVDEKKGSGRKVGMTDQKDYEGGLEGHWEKTVS
jgi:hypothetical protein